MEDNKILDLGNLDAGSADWMKGDAKIRRDARKNQKNYSSATLVGMMLRQAGGRMVLEPRAVASPFEAFSTLEREDGSIVVLNRAYALPEDEPYL